MIGVAPGSIDEVPQSHRKVPTISNLRAVNALDSSTPAASTIFIFANNPLRVFLFNGTSLLFQLSPG